MRFVAEHKDRTDGGKRWGVESICAVLTEHGCPIAPSTYYAAASRLPSQRAQRDEDLKVEIARVHAANYSVYGPRKVWLALNREVVEVARCTVERLMRDLGLTGALRGKRVVTTRPGPKTARPADLVQRRFLPLAPNRVWVADFTYSAQPALNAVKTHCDNGHEFTPENTYVRKSWSKGRQCVTCSNERKRAYYRAKRLAREA